MSIWEEAPQIASQVDTESALKELRSIDSEGMLEAVLEMPRQIESAFKASQNYNEGEIPIDSTAVHLLGLGGSAVAGDLLGDILAPAQKVMLHRGTIPPRDKRGVIISSYSGDTKEILELAHRVMGGLKSNIFITSGGALAHMGWEWSLPVWRMPMGYSPRAAIGWSLGLLVAALVRWHVLNRSVQDRLTTAASRLAGSLAQGEPDQHPLVQASLPVAKALKDKNALILYSLSCSGSARRLAAQLNENAKHPAFTVVMPEGLHNNIEGIGGADPKDWTIILLADQYDPSYLRDGMGKAADLLTKKGFTCVPIPAAGKDQYELTLSRLLVGDFISLFLAGIKNVDPTPIPTILELKATLEVTSFDVEDDTEIEDDDVKTEQPDQ